VLGAKSSKVIVQKLVNADARSELINTLSNSSYFVPRNVCCGNNLQSRISSLFQHVAPNAASCISTALWQTVKER
jgi:hypothetical protein